MCRRMQSCHDRDGFTLIELMVVITIIVLVSAVALPAVLPALAHRQVSEAGRMLQGALVGARDKAIHDGRPSGIRLLPDPAFTGINPATGLVDPAYPLAYSRIVPIDPAPEYTEGYCTVRPSVQYANVVTDPTGVGKYAWPTLVLEEAPTDKHGAPNPPTSWLWNVRVGDKVQLNGAGPWYTIVGPMVMGPAAGNSEMYVNVGAPGSVSPLGFDYLLLVNGRDDNGNGAVDEGWDGVDNNGDGLIDEHRPDQVLVVDPKAPPPWDRTTRDEWEREAWIGGAAAGMSSVPYTIRRRPLPSPNAREVALPTQMVIDAARSQLPVNVYTGAVEILINPDGTAQPSLPYGTPSSLSIGTNWYHFGLDNRSDVVAPSIKIVPPPEEDWSILSLNGRSGAVVVDDAPDPAHPFAYAIQGGR